MAGPFHQEHPHRLHHQQQQHHHHPAALYYGDDDEEAGIHAYHHFNNNDNNHVDEALVHGDDADERAPFYSHQNSSYYNHHNTSDTSLPLYRSRSQSLSMAPTNSGNTGNNGIRAVDYTRADTAAARRTDHGHGLDSEEPLPQRPIPERGNTLQSSTTTSSTSNNHHHHYCNDTSQSTTWSSNANTLTNSQQNPTSTATAASTPSHHHDSNNKKRIDWADQVARVFDPSTGETKTYPDEKIESNNNNNPNGHSNISRSNSPQITPGSVSRRYTETDMEEDNNGFDDYDWDDDDELVKQLDKKYEEEYKKQIEPEEDLKRRRGTVIRKFSPVHLIKLLLFTFLGNVILILALITPALVVQFLVKGQTQDEHLQFVCDNIEAWCYWIAFNFIAKWLIHSLFDLIPKIFVWFCNLVWGNLNEKFIGYVEMFNASAPYIKPLFFAGFFWGSFAVTFNSIFHLRDISDPANNSRAPYTYRIYQVVELLFFIALIYSIEKILIRYISLNFHAVAYADRIKNNSFALSTIDKLKNYRPKKNYRKTGTGYSSGFNTPSAFSRVGFANNNEGGGGGGGYFSSPIIGRSRANTPPFGNNNNNNSPHQQQMNSPNSNNNNNIPNAPEPSHHSLWSRLPIPPTFRSSHGHNHHGYHQNLPSVDLNNAIPLQVTNQNQSFSASEGNNRATGNGRTIIGHPTQNAATIAGYNNTSPQNPLKSSQPGSGNASIPTTPASIHHHHHHNHPSPSNSKIEEKNQKLQAQKNKKSKKLHLFGKKATAQQIARQAMIDPLKTLNDPDNIIGKNLGNLEFGSAKDAKKLARDLFYAFRSEPSRNYLVTSDFYPAFKSETEAEAAFAVFDKDGNGDISRPEIRATILAAYKERRFLARSLQDVSEAVSTLDRLFQVAALIILALVAFAIFQVNIYSNLTTAYTIAIAASFIFKSAAQNVFDSVIFLFATHPFDSGDRIFLEGEVYVVKQLGLFSTLFTKWDGTETMIANSKLGTLTITNLRRSPPQFENATLQFGWNTTLEQLDELEKKMNNWLQKDEKRMFAPSTAVVLQSFNYMRYIEVTIGMLHRENWQDWGERWNRRTAFHAALLHYCKEVGITFVNSVQPVQYFQDDLNQPPIEEDNDDLDDMRSPLSPIDGDNQIPAPAPLQPLMGFLPPEGSTMRRRKGYSKSKNMAGVGA